ncbi:MAG: DNA-binding response regulator [Methylocystis sp.]
MAEPLRKLKDDGSPYTRPPDVEASIDALRGLPRAELVERCRISDPNHPSYVKSECVLHFVRQAKADNNDRHFEALFRILRTRVQHALPAIDRSVEEGESALVQASAIEIRDAVLFRFQELLCQDRAGYDDRLDYFEIRFDGAIANLRRTARRKTWKEENRSQPLSYDDETSELSSEVEDALARLNPQSPEKIDDPAYRKRFAAAIDSLPEDQRRVIVLLLRDIQIESKDPEAVTIVKVLACSEKTVRNRRDRAFKALRAALDEDLGE